MSEEQAWICRTCGGHYGAAAHPPEFCVICRDERQWEPADGPQWTTMRQLQDEGFVTDFRAVEPDLFGLGVRQSIGVGQRGLLVRTDEGTLLWDPPAYLDDAAREAVTAAGDLRWVSSSHPHMYGAIADWATEFDATALLPEADVRWIQRPIPGLQTYQDTATPLPGVHLLRTGGHFPGSAVLHWSAGADGNGALFVGDTIFVTPRKDTVSFLWSAPNRLPLPERHVQRILDTIAPYPFARIYGGWWTPTVQANGDQVVRRSAERYLQFLRGDVDIDG